MGSVYGYGKKWLFKLSSKKLATTVHAEWLKPGAG